MTQDCTTAPLFTFHAVTLPEVAKASWPSSRLKARAALSAMMPLGASNTRSSRLAATSQTEPSQLKDKAASRWLSCEKAIRPDGADRPSNVTALREEPSSRTVKV